MESKTRSSIEIATSFSSCANILPFPPVPPFAQRSTPRPEFLTPVPYLSHRFPFRNSPRQFRIGFVTDKGPAFLVAAIGAGDVVVVGKGVVFDQGFGVLEIAVDGLDGIIDTRFLFTLASVWMNSFRRQDVARTARGEILTFRICSPNTLALMIIR